jgi:arylsulfatase A-like enzyme
VATHDPGIQSVYYLSFAGGYAHYELAGGTLAGPAVDAANRYLLATLQNTHQPNVVAFCRRDATFSSATSGWKADHGGNGWHSQQIPLIIAGPGVRSGTVDWQPAQLIDVAPTALQLLGVAPTGMEGHVLTDALSRPEVADQRSRSTEVAAVSPVVKALLQQDTFERTHRIR